MGYTHYWTMKRDARSTFQALADDARVLATAFETDGKGLSENDGPEFSGDVIRFNGKEPNDYESFILTPDVSSFEFCKTQFRPYDALVCATLIAAKHHLGDAISIKSDGDWSEWDDGRVLYGRAFPDRAVESVIDSDEDDED